MRKRVTLLLMLACVICHAQLSQKTINAMTWGAKTKVTFLVVDYDGRSVSNANIRIYWTYDYTNKTKKCSKKTSKDGMVVLEEKSRGTFTYFVEKGGYYKSQGEYSFDVRGETRIKGGRWEPWNPTVKIVLKEKRNPIPMVATAYLAGVPIAGKPLGYDLEAGDWTSPHGSGKTADIEITYNRVVTTNTIRRYKSTLSLAFPNPHNGCYVVKKEDFSAFDKPYEAEPPKERRVDFILDGTDEKIIVDDRLDANEVLVFRIRTEVDDQGEIVKCHYGFIDGPFKFATGPAKRLRLKSVFNPLSLDRNLEWDGKGTRVRR
jgi:hypothetical protein